MMRKAFSPGRPVDHPSLLPGIDDPFKVAIIRLRQTII
jgi:hypothetical protein